MNIIISHGFAHRLRNDGIVESCPVVRQELPQDDVPDMTALLDADWEIRNLEDMDLTGGDYSVIKDMLFRLRDIFSVAGRRLPVTSKPKQESAPEASAVA